MKKIETWRQKAEPLRVVLERTTNVLLSLLKEGGLEQSSSCPARPRHYCLLGRRAWEPLRREWKQGVVSEML